MSNISLSKRNQALWSNSKPIEMNNTENCELNTMLACQPHDSKGIQKSIYLSKIKWVNVWHLFWPVSQTVAML